MRAAVSNNNEENDLSESEEEQHTAQLTEWRGNVGYLKPRIATGDNDLQAAKEYLSSAIGRRIGAYIPQFDIIPECPRQGFSHKLPDEAVHFDENPILADDRVGAIVVVDMITGACERSFNLLSLPSENRIASIDYAFSCNTLAPSGIGNPQLYFGKKGDAVQWDQPGELYQQYPQEITDHLQKNPELLVNAVITAQAALTNGYLDEIFNNLPNTHASNEQRRDLKRFYKTRINNLHILAHEFGTRVLDVSPQSMNELLPQPTQSNNSPGHGRGR